MSNYRYKGKGKESGQKKREDHMVRGTETVNKTVEVSEEALLKIISKMVNSEELNGKEMMLMTSMGTRYQILREIVFSQTKQKEFVGESTPGIVLELFKKRMETLTKPPFVVVVKATTQTVPAPTTPTPTAPKKEIVKWEGKGREERHTDPMRYEEEPEGRHDNIFWGTPKRYDFGKGQVEAAVPAYSNRQKVWLVFSVPPEDKDLGYPRPIVVPWGATAKFGNVFRTDLPAFSQETTDGIVIIRSEVHFAQEVLQKKGSVTVLFKGEEFCLIHVEDERTRRRIEQDLNRAQKETTGKNPWITTRLGLLRSPEYRVQDATVLEILRTAVMSAKAREEKEKVTVPKTVTQKMQDMGFLR